MKKKTIRIRTALTYKMMPSDYESNRGDSLTVPGEAYTIEELLIKSQGGIPIESLVHVKDANYSDTEDFDDVNPAADPAFDFTDADQMFEESNEIIKEAQELQKASKKQKKKPTPSKSATKEDEPSQESSEADDPIGEND